MLVRVGLPSGSVHEVPLDDDALVRDLESAIIELEAVADTHRVRLIAAGKLLAEPQAALSSVISDGGFVHCAISERPPERPPRRERRRRSRRLRHADGFHMTTDQNGDITVYITGRRRGSGRSDGAASEGEGGEAESGAPGRDGSDGGEGDGDSGDGDIGEIDGLIERGGGVLHAVNDNGEVRIIIPSLTVRGFDRLGLSPEEVAALRRQFRAAHGRPVEEEGGDVEADLEMEEAWLSAALDEGVASGASAEDERESEGRRRGRRRRARGADGRIVVANSAEGSNTDFLLGCVSGYMLGVLVLALLLDRNISRRWRVGIVAGVATNCAFGILRSSLYVQPSGSSFPG